jgi:hypothetical protein
MSGVAVRGRRGRGEGRQRTAPRRVGGRMSQPHDTESPATIPIPFMGHQEGVLA